MKPNILFILSDQHNAKCIAHRGHADVKTPNMDRLASEGVAFENAVSQNPICTPSRMSFLSGQYCHNHGYYGLSGPNPKGLPTILGHFRRQGYKTAAIGKIHCPEYWVEDDCDLFLESGVGSIGANPEYKMYCRDKGILEIQNLETGAKDPDGNGQLLDGFPSELPYEDQCEGWISAHTREFMKTCVDEDKPFIVHASLPKPHQVYNPAKQFWDLYDEANLSLPPNADWELEGKSPGLKRQAEYHRTAKWTKFEPRTFEAGRLRKLRAYLAGISQVDHAIGEMLDFLDENGIADNTIVIYSSDHGDYACEHGIMEKAPGICSDAITRIPYMWRWQGHFKQGEKPTELVESVDVATTLCSLAGVEPLETGDGQDLSGLLKGERESVHEIAVTEFAWSKCVYKDKYRLVYYQLEMFPEEYPDGFGELYDLANDPWEMKNLYFDPEYQSVVREMEKDLMRWLIRTTRPATISPNYAEKASNVQCLFRYKQYVNPDGKIHWREIEKRAGANYI